MEKIEIDWPEVLQVSHSRIKSWRRCQMQHHYRYVQKLRKIKKGIALYVGTGIHAMLEAQTLRGDWKPEMTAFRKEFDKLFKEEIAELGDVPGTIEGVVHGYINKYQNDGLSYIPRHRKARAEIKMIVDLDSRTRFLGFIDKFPQDTEGRNWIMDHKSCKSIPDEPQRFADLQLLFYTWLAPQLGYPKPDGVIWDYIRKKAPAIPDTLKAGGLSKAAKIDTTYEVYMETVDKVLGPKARPDYEDFAQSLKGKEEKFYRRIYLPTPNQRMVDNVVRDVISSAEEIRQAGPMAQVRNMTKDCSFCSYYSICQAEVRGLDSEFIRKTEYTTTKEKLHAAEENLPDDDGPVEE
jgi:hypothetical protein